MHHQTELFQVKLHCYCNCVVVVVVVVVCSGYSDGGVIAYDFADDHVVVLIMVMLLQLFRSF